MHDIVENNLLGPFFNIFRTVREFSPLVIQHFVMAYMQILRLTENLYNFVQY